MMMSGHKIETWPQREFASKIIKILEDHGPTYFGELRKLGHFNNSLLSKALRTLVDESYVFKVGRRHVFKLKKGVSKSIPRTYFSVTPESKARWDADEKAIERQKGIEVLRCQYVGMSARELTELYEDIESECEYWFNRVREWSPNTAGFSIEELPIHSKDYDGSITIEWNLTSEGKKKFRSKVFARIPVRRATLKRK